MNATPRNYVEVWRKKDLIDYVLLDLERRVKRDRPTKLSVFFTGLSAYLPEPINLFLKGESGIGKSYNVVQTLQYFPKEDVWFLGGLSPTALIHDHGQLIGKDGQPLDLQDKPVKPKRRDYASKEEYQKALKDYLEQTKAYLENIKYAYTLINMRNKILVFLEAPHPETYQKLLPILSHDTERIDFRFTDRTVKGPLRTQRVVIEGWPATIFCASDKRYMEELSTRSFTATPEFSKEKIEQANVLTNFKASFPWQFSEETEEEKCIKALIESLKRQLANGTTDVVIPFSNLHELFPKQIIRDMRDFQHFTHFLKPITLLHFYQRPFMKMGDKRFIISTVEDVRKALEIYAEVFETTRTGTEERLLNFYHQIVKTKDGWYLNEITAKYNELHKEKPLSSDSIALMLKRLSEIGYVNIEKDSVDKRLNVYRPLVMENEEKSEIQRVLTNREVLSSKLEKGFKEWLTKYPKNAPMLYYKNFSEDKWGEAEISLEEASKIILGEASAEIFSYISNSPFFGYFSKPNSELKTEKKLKNERKKENRRISANSKSLEGLIQCEYCKAQGKPMHFASESDLKKHVEALHGGYPKLDYAR